MADSDQPIDPQDPKRLGNSTDPTVDVSPPVAGQASARSGQPHEPPFESKPQQIGPYKILEQIGEGGMGTVYLAEQRSPVRRRVALKVIKLGMDTKQVLARFEIEQHALAIMNHPNIARVLDAGATPSGRPYFVMEYVQGIPINDYCDRNRLTNRRRLDLFIQVCNGVQHAHQKGVIHRDLKPSNILVMMQDGKPVPKIIDFGVAKATAQQLTERTLFTELGQLIGTPEYMSPEQAEMTAIDIDTRTDVYSLGVILYELLVGAMPFDTKTLRRAGYAEIHRIIREVDPLRPSTRLSSLEHGDSTVAAKHRNTDVRGLAKHLRGDLDWIILKALEKDRTRRYETASAFAADLARHINDHPVDAGPPSATYRLGKLVRRNKLLIGAGASVILALAIGLVVSTGFYVQAEGERSIAVAAREDAERARSEALRLREAEAELRTKAEANEKEAKLQAEQLEETLKFVQSMLASARPQVAKGRELTVREVLDSASERIRVELKAQPLVQARVLGTIARTYLQLGQNAEAIAHFESVRDVLLEQYGRLHINSIRALSELADAHYQGNETARAVELNQEGLQDARDLWGEEHLVTASIMGNLGNQLRAMGRINDAEPLVERQFELRKQLHAPRSDMAAAQSVLGWFYKDQGRFKEAEGLIFDSLQIRLEDWGEASPRVIQQMGELAYVYLRQGNWAEAEHWYGKSVSLARKYLDPTDEKILQAIVRHSMALERLDRFEEAEIERRDFLQILRDRYGEQSADVCSSLSELTRLASRGGREDAAKGYAQELAALGRAMLEESEIDMKVLNSCAMMLLELEPKELRDPQTALMMARRAVDSMLQDDPFKLDTFSLALEQTGDIEAAIEAQERAVNAISPNNIEPNIYVAVAMRWFDLVRSTGDKEEEDRVVKRVLRPVLRDNGERGSRHLRLMNILAVRIGQRGRIAEAILIHGKLFELAKSRYPEGHPMIALPMSNLGAFMVDAGQYDEAVPLLRQSLAMYVASSGNDAFNVGNVRSHLGECLMKLARYSEAESEQLESYRVLKGVNGAEHSRTLRSARRLVGLYEAWGKLDIAAKWREKLPSDPSS